MKHPIIHGILGCLFTIAMAQAQSGTNGFRPLFNGKDLIVWEAIARVANAAQPHQFH